MHNVNRTSFLLPDGELVLACPDLLDYPSCDGKSMSTLGDIAVISYRRDDSGKLLKVSKVYYIIGRHPDEIYTGEKYYIVRTYRVKFREEIEEPAY